MAIKALLFDFDGTLVDSETEHLAVWNQLLAKYSTQLTLTQYQKEFIGLPVPAIAKILRQQFNLQSSVEQLAAEKTALSMVHFQKQPLPLMPYAREILQQTYRQGWRLALVTGTGRAELAPTLQHHQLSDFFEIIITRNEVKHSKPDPESYLLALTQMNLNADQAIALEDSYFGLLAARRAKLTVIALPHQQAKREEFTEAAYIANNLGEAFTWLKENNH